MTFVKGHKAFNKKPVKFDKAVVQPAMPITVEDNVKEVTRREVVVPVISESAAYLTYGDSVLIEVTVKGYSSGHALIIADNTAS
jgi:hypothetical protein